VLVWHFAQAVVAWAPVSANEALEWLKAAGLKAVVVWQVEHTVDRPAWLTAAAAVVWQDEQAVGVPR
jgi:hypothetical protein